MWIQYQNVILISMKTNLLYLTWPHKRNDALSVTGLKMSSTFTVTVTAKVWVHTDAAASFV